MPEEFKLGHHLSFWFLVDSLRFLVGYLRGLEDDKGEKTTGKVWTKRGQNMVKRGENVVANVVLQENRVRGAIG